MRKWGPLDSYLDARNGGASVLDYILHGLILLVSEKEQKFEGMGLFWETL